MVALSKLFKTGIENAKCHDIIHDGTCTMNVVLNSYKFLLSNMKYFAPVIGFPLLVHIRSLNNEMLKSTLKYYMEAVVCGTAVGCSIMFMICFLRNVLGKFGYYTSVFVPTLVGSFATWLVPSPKVHRLFVTSVLQCTIESIILQQKHAFSRLIAKSALLRTIMFMCCSGLILNAKRCKAYKGFWLLNPTPLRAPSPTEADIQEVSAKRSASACSHKDKSCTLYAVHGIRNYMIVGFTLDVIKMLMAKVALDRKGFVEKMLLKLRNFKIRSCALLTSYIAIYRLLHCYFNRRNGSDSTLNHITAAFLSGSCFIFYPKLTLLCYAVVLGIQISCQHIKAYLLTSEQFSNGSKWVQGVPFTKILYSLALAYLVNTYCFRKRYVSSLGEAMINGLTNNYARRINETIDKLERQFASSS